MSSSCSSCLDEAHCLWPLCSHTCCWEAEHRTRGGKPRKTRARAPGRAPATASDADRFPAITVVNASQWPDTCLPIDVRPLKSQDDFSKAAKRTLGPQVLLQTGAKTQENVQKANSSLAIETDRKKKMVKLKPVVISPLTCAVNALQSSERTVMWVPSSCYIPPKDSQRSPESRCLAVKHLIFTPNTEMRKPAEHKNKTSGRTHLQRTSRLNQEGKGSLKWGGDFGQRLTCQGSAGDPQVRKVSVPTHVLCLVPRGQNVSTAPEVNDVQQPPRSGKTHQLRNNPMVFESVLERIQRGHTQEEHPTFKYNKLDLRTGADRADWESLRRQTCLWRRDVQPVVSLSCSQDKADHVPFSLIPTLSSLRLPRSSAATGSSQCRNMEHKNRLWQSYCQFLASTSKGASHGHHRFRFWFSTWFHKDPGRHAETADARSDKEFHGQSNIPPQTTLQSSEDSSTVDLTRSAASVQKVFSFSSI